MCKPDGRYSVGETCKLLGIARSTLLRYTNNGDISFIVRRLDKRKLYKGSEILRIWRASL